MTVTATAAFRQQMLAWLTGLQGNGVIPIQQLLGQSGDDGSNGLQAVFNASGKWPGGVAGNYYNNDDSHPPSGGYAINTAAPNAKLIEWWNAGGIVSLSGFMWPSPSVPGGGPANPAFGTPVNGADLITSGTATNSTWLAILDQVAAGIQQLADNGIVALFRPLHESNGNWFWWGTGLTDAQFVALWRLTYSYLATVKGLANNLIWVYSPNGINNLTARYPGNAYVDIVAFDYYDDNPSNDAAAAYNSLTSYGKPVAWGEWGPNSNSVDETVIVNAIRRQVPKVIYWEQWSTHWAISNQSNISAALNDPLVLTRDRLNRPVLSSATPTPTPTPTPAPGGVIANVTPAPALTADSSAAHVRPTLPSAQPVEDYVQAMMALGRRGRAWPIEPDTTRAALTRGLVQSHVRSSARAINLVFEAFPSTTTELINEWEWSLGLPDPCSPINASLEQRRAAALAKFIASGGQSIAYYQSVAAALGYSITVTEFNTPPYHWQINADAITPSYFMLGAGLLGDYFWTSGAAELECRMRQIMPAHTVLIFSYGGVISPQLINDHGVLALGPEASPFPSSAAGLAAGALWSNGGVVSVVPGATPNPSAPPVYYRHITSAELFALGGGNLPTSNPGPGTGQLWNSGGEVWIA